MSTLRTFNLQNPDSGTVNIEMDQGGNTLMTGIATVRGAAHFTSTSGSDAVGIGTDITAYKLDVRVTGADAGLRIYNPDTSSNASGIIRLGNDDNQNSAFLRLNGSNNTSAVGGAANLVLGTGTAREVHLATSGTSRFKITSSGVKQVLNGNLNIYQTYIDFSGDQSSTPQTAVALYRPQDGTFAISTQNTERFRIRSDGRITIGTQTINTNSMLSIHRSSSDESQIRFTNTTTGEGGNNGLLVGIDSNEHGRIFNQENSPIRFGTNNTERLRIRAEGPHFLLGTGGDATYNEITESSSNAGLVIGSGSMGNGGIVIRNSTSGTGRIYFADNSGSDPGRQRGQINYYHSGDYMTFATAGSERLRITSNGSMGLGTNSPNSKMHLMGGNLQIGDFSADGYETKLGNNILTFKRNGTAYVDQIGTGPLTFRFGSSYTSSLTLQNAAECVKVTGTTADTGTSGGSRGLTLQTGGGTSCPLYFGSETNSAQKSMYMTGYWIYLRGHQNEGIRFVFSQSSGNAPRSDQYQFKYNQATRPTGNTTWDGFSDRRAKENVQDVTSALDTIGRLRPVTFDWTNDYADRMNMFNMDKTDPKSYNWFSVKENGYDESRKNNNVGFIAQEFEEVFPKDITETEMELGDETITDFKTVNFDSLVPMLTKAVQELKAENDSLRARLDAAGL